MRRLASAARLALTSLLAVPMLLAVPASAREDVWLRALVPDPPPAPAAPEKVAPKGGARSRAAKPAPVRPVAPGLRSGDSGPVELTRGATFPAAGVAVPPAEIDRTLLRLGGGRPMPLTGARADGSVTRLDATYAGSGLATLAVQLLPRFVAREAPAFEAYLTEVAAEDVLAERRKKKDTRKAGREVVLETAKTFVAVHDPKAPPSAPDAGEPLGLPIELTLGTPLPARAGAALIATLLVAGQPARGVTVRLLPPAGEPQSAVTDEKGQVAFTPGSEGSHLVSAALVRPLAKADRKKGDAYKKADWEGFATTLRLDVAAPAPVPTPAPTPKKGKPKPRR